MALISAQGTRFFVTDDVLTIIPSTSDEIPEGKELKGVTSATVHYEVNAAVRADLKVFIAHEAISGKLHWYANDPQTVDWKEIRRIEFDDGSVFEC